MSDPCRPSFSRAWAEVSGPVPGNAQNGAKDCQSVAVAATFFTIPFSRGTFELFRDS